MTSKPESTQGATITKSDLTRMAVNPGAPDGVRRNYPKQMSIPFCMMLTPLLKKIYRDDPEGYAAALTRHLEFFNITMYFAPFVGGVVASMEERVAKGEMEPETISSVKAALMGPLSGIGDSLFLGTLRVIAAAVGIGLSLAGNPFGPIAFLAIYNIPCFLTRIIGAQKGYELGVSFLTAAQESGLMNKVIYAAGYRGYHGPRRHDRVHDVGVDSHRVRLGRQRPDHSVRARQHYARHARPGCACALLCRPCQEGEPHAAHRHHYDRGHPRRLHGRFGIILAKPVSLPWARSIARSTAPFT